MHMLVELHGQPGWVAALTPFSVDGMIVAASTTLLADSRSGSRGGVLPWALLVVGSVASLAANVAVAEPTVTGRVIAAWPSFALIAAYELLMRQVRRSATIGTVFGQSPGPRPARETVGDPAAETGEVAAEALGVGDRCSRRLSRDLQRLAWQWAQENRTIDGTLPSGREIARQYDRHERWGRLVKRSGCAGEFVVGSEPGLRLVERQAVGADCVLKSSLGSSVPGAPPVGTRHLEGRGSDVAGNGARRVARRRSRPAPNVRS